MEYKILAKYVKDLRFFIPNADVFFLLAKNISNYKINFDIKSAQIKKNLIEVETSLTLNPKEKDFEKIDTKIIYAAVVQLGGDVMDKDELEKIILAKVPLEIYPEIREIFITLFEKSGFKDIKIDKYVDFENLYKKRKINKNFS